MKIYPPVGGGSATTDASLLTSGTLPLARLSGITTTELDAAAGIVSGQIAGLSLSKLTAGTLIPSLKLDYGSAAGTGTVTAGSTQILNTSTGLQLNVQSTKSIALSVNDTAILTLGSTLQTPVPLRWTTDVALSSSLPMIGLHSATQMAINVPTGSTIADLIDGTAVWTASGAIATSAVPIKWSTNVSLIAADYSIGRDGATSIAVNAGTAGVFAVKVNASQQQSFGVNGITLDTAAGTVTAATRGIYQTSAGVTINTPTGTEVLLSINAASMFIVNSAGIRTAGYFRFTAAGSSTAGQTEIYADASAGNLYLNAPTAKGVYVRNNGSTSAFIDGTGIGMGVGKNIVLDTGTGTKIGTDTTQKLGFWNATPIIQPTTAVAAATLAGGGGTALTDTHTFDGYTLLQVVKALRNEGLLA